MKKSIRLSVLLLFLSALPVFAGDFSFVFEDARFHSSYWGGLAPFYVRAGAGYTGLSLIDGQQTEIVLVGGGAITSNNLWTDADGLPLVKAVSNSDLTTNMYSRWQWDLGLGLIQGLFADPKRANPVLSVYARYDLHNDNPAGDDLNSILESSTNQSAYPDQGGVLTNSLKFGVEFNRLTKGDINKGYGAELWTVVAPSWMGNEVLGDSNFYNIAFEAKAFYPLLDIKMKNSEKQLVGIYAGDRIRADWLDGTAIPEYFQEPVTLGGKMRGFEWNSMGTQFTVVNNFDIRVYGLEFIDNTNPVFNVFFDMGYFAGNYYNTSVSDSGFVSSTGFEAAINIIDFAQVGFCFAFPLTGENMRLQDMTTDIMFMYKF